MRKKNWNQYIGEKETAPPVKRIITPPKPIAKIKKPAPYQEDMILLEQSVMMMCFKKRFNDKKCTRLKEKSHKFCHYKKLINLPKSYQKCIRKQAKSIY